MKMKIALLHLDLSGGPKERNTKLICDGIRTAAKNGASWIITPEMALQGYFFTKMGREYTISVNFKKDIKDILKLAKELKVVVFLGCAEHYDGDNYNACVVINDHGEIIGRHRKMKIVGSNAEGWSVAGNKLECISCDDLSVGVLVCADAWFGENAEQLGNLGADLIIVVAAWPPGCGGPPENAWERCSKMSGGLPVIICNQTGTTNKMNCLIAKSAAVYNGKILFDYQGLAAILMLDFDCNSKKFISRKFVVLSE